MASPESVDATPLLQRLHTLPPLWADQAPAISLYLNVSGGGEDGDSHADFCRRAFADHVNAWSDRPAQQHLLGRGLERIEAYLEASPDPSIQGLALFAAAGVGEDGLFEAIGLDRPFDEHWLFVGDTLHLAPLEAWLARPPRAAAVLLDDDAERIVVFGRGPAPRRRLGPALAQRPRTAWPSSEWSQVCYERRDGSGRHDHGPLLDALERIVRNERVPHVVIAGNPSLARGLEQALPPALAERLVTVERLTAIFNDTPRPPRRGATDGVEPGASSRRSSPGAGVLAGRSRDLAATLWLKA